MCKPVALFAATMLCLIPLHVKGEERSTSAPANFNYAEALQKALYFYEAQQSGRLSPNNRVAWRGPSAMEDGKDIGRDLSGGWYDAGDHWKANLTMAFAAMTLAWSAVEQPEGYLKSGQMDELLESLIFINEYFLKCVLNPDCQDPASELEVVVACGGREGVESPNVHAMWAPAEVAHLLTNRPTFRVNKQVPGGDVPAAIAGAMAASAMVVREHGAVLRGKRGYESFDPEAFAAKLLDRAEKLTIFARANWGQIETDDLPSEQKQEIQKKRNLALRGDGEIVEIGYRAGAVDKVFTAASWLARAFDKRDMARSKKWFDLANSVYDNEYRQEHLNDFWRDFGAGNVGKLGAYNMMRLAPDEEKYHNELQYYCVSFTKYKETPGGLRLREWHAHQWGSLRHANNAAAIALYYSKYVEKSPKLVGNTWWKGSKSNAELAESFRREAKRQVDYALGGNPYGRSYLVGFGNRPFNDVHHRGAFGSWAGFEHFIPGKPDCRPLPNRHVLYGALVGGPDHNDVFLCGDSRRPWKDGPYYLFPNRKEPIPAEGYRFDPADQPYQDVMDPKLNEVALDYNAGITASFAWLTAQGESAGSAIPDADFPPADPRNDNTDLLTTDREFFAATRQIPVDGGVEVDAVLFNRTRWPARIAENLSLRYYFTLEPSVQITDVKAELRSGDARISPAKLDGKRAYLEVSVSGTLFPGDLRHDRRRATFRITATKWDSSNDPSFAPGEKLQIVPAIPVYKSGKLASKPVPW